MLDRQELISELIKGTAHDINELVRKSLEDAINQLLDAEFKEAFARLLQASEKDYRNGSYERKLISPYGTLNLRLSRDRLNHYQTKVLDDYQRRMGALDDLANTLYSKGLSCSDVKEVLMETCNINATKKNTLHLCCF